MIALRGLTRDLCEFLFDLLKAGNWMMLTAMTDAVAITTSQHSVNAIPDGFSRVVVCTSPEELGALLRNGVQTWEKYRDQVVGEQDDES